ncbi:MAG: glycoside hydrolase family 97 protein [Bryobacteraceae bacterium]|jgi:alpha-glucosidase
MNIRWSYRSAAVLVATVLLSCRPAAAAAGASRAVRSPDGKIAIAIHTDSPLGYSITVDGKPLLQRSRIGLELAGDVKLGEKPVVQSVARKSADKHWVNQFGKNRNVRDHYNELTLMMKEGERTFGVVARAYNDGVAFRMVLPNQPGMDAFTVTRDATEFTFPDDEQVWAGWNNPEGAVRPEGGFIGSQEWRYLPNKLSGLNPNFKHGLPFLVQTPAAYVAITESDLLDWSGMWLVPKAGARNTLEAQLAPPIPVLPWAPRTPAGIPSGPPTGTPLVPTQEGLVVGRTPHNSPWRAFIIGRQPSDLMQSDLVLNLATPSQLADVSWVKPGMSAWGTWWPNVGRNDLPTLKQYIQLAADMNWPYQLSEIGDKSIVPDLVAFGKERGVRIWLWFHFNDFIDSAVYKRDFPMYAKWGLAGLKIDFIDRDDQWAVKWYEDIARTAAENHLLIDFHGAFKPTGLNRTWPNQITREGIQGDEYDKWSDKETPEHKATLPFTRVLAGGADYTPGGFANRQPSQFRSGTKPTQVQGTRASELAMFILIESPFTVACDSPDDYKDQDGKYLPGMDFLKGLPTVWDETRGLAGEVGKYAVEVRRNGKNWYLAAIADRNGRELPVPLTFLGQGNWKVTLWEDAPDAGENAEHLVRDERTVRPSDSLQLKLAPSGGTVAIFSPAK